MNSPILDIAIVLVFTYLLLSIIASSAYEIIITKLRARNMMLKEAISKLFFDDAWKNDISEKLLNSPSIKVLKRTEDSFPSYIPSNSFAMAIIGLLRDGEGKVDIESIRKKLEDPNCIIKGEAKTTLLNLLDTCKDDYNQFIKNLERFFDDYMDRVSGWFKLKYQFVMLILSIAVTIILNVDSIEITNSLWKDKNKLNIVADAVVNSFENYKLDSGVVIVQNNANNQTQIVNVSTKLDSTRITLDSANKIIKDRIQTIKTLNTTLVQTEIPMGWNAGNYPEMCKTSTLKWLMAWLTKVIGWIITAGAVYMGAPFWFDLLSKLVNLRGTGKKPEVSKDKSNSND
jgi:hypothetical protein